MPICDTYTCLLAWTNVPRRQGGLGEVKIPLVSDIKKEISAAYNGSYTNTCGRVFVRCKLNQKNHSSVDSRGWFGFAWYIHHRPQAKPSRCTHPRFAHWPLRRWNFASHRSHQVHWRTRRGKKIYPFGTGMEKKIVLANNDVCLRYAPLTGRKAKRLSSPTPRTPRNTLKLSTNKDYNVAVCAFCKRPRLSESGVTSTKTTEWAIWTPDRVVGEQGRRQRWRQRGGKNRANGSFFFDNPITQVPLPSNAHRNFCKNIYKYPVPLLLRRKRK